MSGGKANYIAERSTWRGKAERKNKGLKGQKIEGESLDTGAEKTPHIEYSLGGSVITERLYIDGKQDFIKKNKKNKSSGAKVSPCSNRIPPPPPPRYGYDRGDP